MSFSGYEPGTEGAEHAQASYLSVAGLPWAPPPNRPSGTQPLTDDVRAEGHPAEHLS